MVGLCGGLYGSQFLKSWCCLIKELNKISLIKLHLVFNSLIKVNQAFNYLIKVHQFFNSLIMKVNLNQRYKKGPNTKMHLSQFLG